MAEPGLIVKLYDLQSNELADISNICLGKQCSVRKNLPRGLTLEAPAAAAEFTGDDAGDGLPNLCVGARKLIAWEEDRDDTPIFHGRIFGARRVGNGRTNRVTIRAYDPLLEFGTESGAAGRLVRDDTGNFIHPSFGDTVTGADLLYQALANSQVGPAAENPGPGGEGPLPIDIGDGTRFDSSANLSTDNFMSWPLYLGDLVAKLVATGLLDVDLRPVDPTEGLDPYAMVAVSAADSIGSDRSGTVHFDYWTGSHNAKEAIYDEDFATICNKLYDYLGPPSLVRQPVAGVTTRWPDNITPGTAGTAIDPSDSRALYGIFMAVRFFDQFAPTHTDPFNLALWNAEMGYRIAPRELIYITPRPGTKALYRPFGRDFDAGDIVGVNIGAALGVSLATDQRVLGYDVTWSRNNVARMSQLITSADIDLS